MSQGQCKGDEDKWDSISLLRKFSDVYGKPLDSSVPTIRRDVNCMLLPLHRHWEKEAKCLMKGTL